MNVEESQPMEVVEEVKEEHANPIPNEIQQPQ